MTVSCAWASSGRCWSPTAIREIDRGVVGDEANDRLGRLDRRDHPVGVEQQRADQQGRIDLQLPRRPLNLAAAAAKFGLGTAVVGFEAAARLGVGGGDARQCLGVPRRLTGDRQRPGSQLQVEVGFRNREQCIVGRGLEPGLLGIGDPPGRHRLEDRVRDPQDRAQAIQLGVAGARRRGGESVGQRGGRTQEKRLAVDILDLAGGRLDLPVGAIVGWPDEESGQPKGPGRPQVGHGLEDPLPRDGDVGVPCAGHAQGVGQVDRLDDLTGKHRQRERRPRRPRAGRRRQRRLAG